MLRACDLGHSNTPLSCLQRCRVRYEMTTREDVKFTVDGGIELGAWLYLPQKGAGRGPAITMAHGYAGTREHGIARFASAFAGAGFVVLLHDHRSFGVSGG